MASRIWVALLSIIIIALVGCTPVRPEERPGDVVIVKSSVPPQPAPVQGELPPPVVPPKTAPAPPPEPVLRVDFLKAGQADATLVRTPEGKSLLINCGTLQTGQEVLAFLQQQGLTSLDFLLATDARPESIGGCGAIRLNLKIKRELTNALEELSKFPDDATLQKLGYTRKGEQRFLMLSDTVTVGLLTPYALEEGRRAEDNTLVVKISYGENAVLLLGGCGISCQRKLEGGDLTADVVQLAQHGKLETNGDKLIEAIHPSIAVATAAFNNPQKLPNRELVKKLNQRYIKVYRTDVQYVVTMKSDGKTFTMDSQVPYKLEKFG